MRPMVDVYGLMAIPLAALIMGIAKMEMNRKRVFGLVLVFIVYSFLLPVRSHLKICVTVVRKRICTSL